MGSITERSFRAPSSFDRSVFGGESCNDIQVRLKSLASQADFARANIAFLFMTQRAKEHFPL